MANAASTPLVCLKYPHPGIHPPSLDPYDRYMRLRPALLCLVPFLTASCVPQETHPGAPPDVPTVAVAKVTSENLSHNLVLTAEFKPYQEVDVMAKVAGYIRQI